MYLIYFLYFVTFISRNSQKLTFKIYTFNYCRLLLVLNHCSMDHETGTLPLIFLERTDFVARVIDSIYCEIRALQGNPSES